MVHVFTQTHFHQLTVLPSLYWDLASHLNAMALSRALTRSGLPKCPLPLLRLSLTPKEASKGFHHERLEWLGDRVLKTALTFDVFCADPTVHKLAGWGEISWGMRRRGDC